MPPANLPDNETIVGAGDLASLELVDHLPLCGYFPELVHFLE